MTNEPKAPALTVPELYDRLKEKGYNDPHAEGFYQAVLKSRVLGGTLGSISETQNTSYLGGVLELDRREVFRVWYGQGEGEPNHGPTHLVAAGTLYANGKLDFCIDYILQNPDAR